MKTVFKITLIGSGNVATHLGRVLVNNGFTINEVYSKSLDNAEGLAKQLKANATNQITALSNNTDLYLICLKDDTISSILVDFPFKDQLIAHTSGSIPLDIFKEHGFNRYGVFYPLQTFSKEKEVAINEVPFCVEASDNKSKEVLLSIANQISTNVYEISSEQRKILHVAAVFASNFTNHLYSIAQEITDSYDLDFNILKPLIDETTKKAFQNPPRLMQTGPAKRNDKKLIADHLAFLADQPAYQKIYHLLSDSIIDSLK